MSKNKQPPKWTRFIPAYVRGMAAAADGVSVADIQEAREKDGKLFINSRYQVLVIEMRPEEPKHPILVWLSIKNRDGSARHDWRDFQRIKNELVGSQHEGIELYPAEERLVDSSNQFHMWCMVTQEGAPFRFPFGFQERLTATKITGDTVASQRPFEPDNIPADAKPIHLTKAKAAAPHKRILPPSAQISVRRVSRGVELPELSERTQMQETEVKDATEADRPGEARTGQEGQEAEAPEPGQ